MRGKSATVPVNGLVKTGKSRSDYATSKKRIEDIEAQLQRDLDSIRSGVERVLRSAVTANVDIVIRVNLKDGCPIRQMKVNIVDQFIPI